MLSREEIDAMERMGQVHELANLARSQLAEITQLKGKLEATESICADLFTEIDRLKASVSALEAANDELRAMVKEGEGK